MKRLVQRWSEEAGYREVLKISLPLILSTGAWSIQHFVDRMFLSWYSPQAVAASLPAGILNFTLLSLFIGTASYVNTFVAQYYGAKKYERIGQAVWQGLYFSLFALIFMLCWIPLAKYLFQLAGHAPEVQRLETQYFSIICLGGMFPVASSAISSFFSGRGSTWTVMWVNMTATCVNIVLDYLLIFGNFGFPEWGMKGAAIATVLAAFTSFILFCLVMLKKKFRISYHTWKGRKYDPALFRRLVHFGLPNGIQFFLEILGFALFIILIGRYGTIELAATNIAFNINTLAFLPLIGCGIAVSALVGQRLGENRPDLAEKSTWTAVHLTFLYVAGIAVCYVAFPDLFLRPFGYQAEVESFQKIREYGVVLLRFVAFYSIFDAMNILFAAAIKGAGDTRFVMKVAIFFSWTVMVIPTFFVTVVFHWHMFVAWGFASAFIMSLGVVFLFRFLQGKWKSMRVIEEVPQLASVSLPESPAIE